MISSTNHSKFAAGIVGASFSDPLLSLYEMMVPARTTTWET